MNYHRHQYKRNNTRYRTPSRYLNQKAQAMKRQTLRHTQIRKLNPRAIS